MSKEKSYMGFNLFDDEDFATVEENTHKNKNFLDNSKMILKHMIGNSNHNPVSHVEKSINNDWGFRSI